jgi:ABC-type sugar transport system substrate-binding protein
MTVQDPSFAASSIASDNKSGGLEAFKAIENLNPNGGKVLVISTDPGVSTADARVAGSRRAGKLIRHSSTLACSTATTTPLKHKLVMNEQPSASQ